MRVRGLVPWILAVTWAAVAAPCTELGQAPGQELKAIWLIDNFEDGVLDGWSSAGGGCPAWADTYLPANGSYSMIVSGSCSSTYGGWYLDVGPLQATGVQVRIRPDSSSKLDGYFVVGQQDPGGFAPALFVFASSIGEWVVLGGDGTLTAGAYTADQWHLLIFAVDWSAHTFDIHIDGTLRLSDVPFTDAGVTAFGRIHLYNIDVSNAWYDDILFTTPPPQPPIFVDGFESGTLDAWSAVTTG